MIPVRNIYYMLAYAFKSLQETTYKKIETESFDNVAELCSAILYRGVSSQIKQGLVREYIPHREITSSLKGKIDFSDSFKQNTLLKRQMVCTYDNFSVDTKMNQILKTTMMYLLRSDISKVRKKDLRKILVFFDDINELDVYQIDWNLHFSNNNQTYKMLMAICELVIKGMIQTQKDGKTTMMDFIDERQMSNLYEKFILEFYRQERKDVKTSAMKIDWMVDDGYREMLPEMRTDITLTKENKTLIIDAKYYTKKSMQTRYDSRTFHSGNLYQIFTYVKNRKEQVKDTDGKVMGMLLYAKTDESITPNNNKYSMSGNEIIVHSLDLNREFSEIREELNRIADYL